MSAFQPLPGRTIPTAIAAAASAHPRSPALVSPDGTVSFTHLVRAIDGFAAALVGRGIVRGMPVGLVMADGPVDVVFFLALLRLGAPPLVLSALESSAERERLLALLGATATIGAGRFRAGQGGTWIDTEALRPDADVSDLPAFPDPSSVAHFNRSSGTTLGQPKLIAITQGQRGDRGARESAGFVDGPGDVLMHVVPLVNSIGRGMALAALARGAALAFPPANATLADMRAFMQRHGVTAITLTPPYVRDLLRRAEGRTAPLLPGVRLMLASAPISPAERRAVRERLTPLLYVNYGTNEVGPLAIARPDDLDVAPGCVGRATPGVEAEVVGDDLRPLPPGQPGELRFRDPDFPRDYTMSPAGSTSRFVDGWFYPADAGVMDAAGRITLLGRVDEVINVGGRKVHPSAIEAWLTADPRVAEAAAVAIPSLRLGEMPVAAVVLREPVGEAELLDICRRGAGVGIPMPKRVVALPELPRNTGGKIDRRAVRAMIEPHLARRGPSDR